MAEPDDQQLLAEFARNNSEAAFAALVQRYVNLVYSVGLRQTGNPHAAEEITQAVFIILARKAKSLGGKAGLSGWLYQTARLTAANYRRTEARRARREQEAFMQSQLDEIQSGEAWQHIAPLLDDALGQLGERDRHAIVLRFFEGKALSEVGAVLGASEDAAKMRVSRALERLRKIFNKRGVTLSAALIAGAVSANSVQAAPAGLAATVTAAAATGAGISATLTTLVKGTMKTMTWLKLKFAASMGVAALLAGGAATVAVSQTGGKPVAASGTHKQQLLIKCAFVKAPNKEIGNIVRELVKPAPSIDPTSTALRTLIEKHPGARILSVPSISTTDGMQAVAATTQMVKVNGTNVEIGTTLAVTPVVMNGRKVILKISAELRELVAGTNPTIRVTRAEEQTISLNSGETTLVRNQIGSTGADIAPTPGSPAESLMVFVNATLVDGRGYPIKK